MALIEQGWWPVAALILLGSMLAVIYVWRVVEVAYFNEPLDNNSAIKEAPMSFLVPIWILVIANIYFGIDTRLSVQVAEAAAQSLFGVAL